jgi:signal peptide peptidase SppA
VKKKHKISIISIHGQIHPTEGKPGINPDKVRQLFEEVIEKKSELVILDINSPGGSPVGSTMIHNMIKKLQEKEIKVYAHIRDLCASGGYLIVSACDKIFAYPSSIIGSVGVIMTMFGLDKFIEKHDIEYREFTAGEYKSPFSMFKAVDEKAKNFIDEMLTDVHEDFISIVFGARKNEIMNSHKDEIIKAKVFTGIKAKEYGLIDDFKSIQEIIDDEFGKNAKIKTHRPKEKQSFLKKILGANFKINLALFDSENILSLK